LKGRNLRFNQILTSNHFIILWVHVGEHVTSYRMAPLVGTFLTPVISSWRKWL